MEQQILEKALYEACLRSARAMGKRVKQMSWFGKNHVDTVRSEDKVAA